MKSRPQGSGPVHSGLVQFCLAWTLLLGAAGVAGTSVLAQQAATPAIATTTITDTIYRADGTPASGTVLISWPAFTLATGASVPAGSTSVNIGTNGLLETSLVANSAATPIGSYYTVVYHLDDGSVTREYWVVPAAPATVHVANIRSTVLPTSVAMQTVSKAYVDTAIATAVAGHPLDSSTPYVLKSGDSMTGPLVLPADPNTPLEASDKHYVDTQVAGLTAGLGQKVSLSPQSTQTVAQPAGTQLQVNNLNGAEYASQYVTGAGTNNPNANGIANAAASPDCANGCDIVAEHTYASTEQPAPTTWNRGTHLTDHRAGSQQDTYFDPQNGDLSRAQSIDLLSTESATDIRNATGSTQIGYAALTVHSEGLTGGSNEYPGAIQQNIPYFKSTYSAESLLGTYNTPGQHVLVGQQTNCFSVGDCLLGSQFIVTSGGYRDDADEGSHPYDIDIDEDPLVFQGTCASGCTPGSTTLQVNITAGVGTQGEGRYLIDTNAAKVISNGSLIGGVAAGRHPTATFSGTNFPVSTFLETAQTIPSQANDIAPGTVTIPIVTSAVPAGFATNTAALPANSGVACVVDAQSAHATEFETAPYTVVDGSHLRLTLRRPHGNGATIAVGGLCGYGLEQKVDTASGIRQVFPVIGSLSPTSLYYAGGATSIVGLQGVTSGFANVSLVVASIARTGNVVNVTFAGTLTSDVNGLPFTVQGVVDPSYNGTFVVTTTGPSSLTYTQNGPDSTSSGGTLTYVTGGYALYPMAEVVGVYNTATKSIDGQVTLAANNINFSTGDTLEQPHYFQQLLHGDTEYIVQFQPRPAQLQTTGIAYQANNGPGLVGYRIENDVPASFYFGNGGTHTAPDMGLSVEGPWQHALDMQAGETAAIALHCNSHGCDRWNSGYNLFQMDTSAGQDVMNYSPATSNLYFGLRGTGYTFTPQAFTAGTINVTTLNAGSVHGLFTGSVAASSLPVFNGSGSAHAVGAVPDPGAAAGNTRFLREDGTWALTTGGTQVSSAGGYSTNGPANLPRRTQLLGEYLMSEGAGSTVHDTSGAGNDATIVGAAWEGTQDLDFTQQGQYVQLPTVINAAQTIQIAAYFPPFGSATYPQAPGYGPWPGSFGANPSLLCGSTQQLLCLNPGGTIIGSKSMRFGVTSDNTEASEPMPAGWHVFTMICGSNVGGAVVKTRYLYDGAEVGGYYVQGDAGTCPHPSSSNYQLGGSAAYSGTWFLGKIAGAWFYNTQLSLQEASASARAALDYIHTKGVPPAYRAAPSSAPAILAGIDSRTFGVGLQPSQTWLAAMNLTDNSYTRTNLGLPSMTVYDACNQFDLLWGQQITANSGPVISIFLGGASDLLTSSGTQTPRRVANGLRCMVQKAKAAGSRVILSTEISEGSNNFGDTFKNALNPILRAEAYSWGVDNLADPATVPLLGSDGAANNTACFPDNLHPGTVCEGYLTSVFQNAVNELIGSTETQRHRTTAATYTEVAGDRFLDLTGSASQTVTLPDCTGYSLPRQMLNLGTAAATVNAASGQTLAGSTTIAPGARGVFLPVPGALNTGGCSWERTQ